MRLLTALALALAALALPGAPRAAAAADGDDAAAAACRCETANACWHFLNAPFAAPEGTCACAKCTPTSQHDGSVVPAGWNRECWTSQSADCFLQRHAASWRLVCTECETGDACCRQPHPERCPACQDGDAKDPRPRDHAATAKERLEQERRIFTKSRPIAVVGRHAYVVTDVTKARVRTQGGGFRWATGHELAHILATRAEIAWREFSDTFAVPSISRPVGIFVTAKESVARELKGVYFRNPGTHMIYSSYGGSTASAISGGFCLNGFCVSVERLGDDDRTLHQAVRHLYANIAFTNWIVQNGEERTTPPWAFEGIAHWFGKRPAALADEVWWCEGEDGAVSGTGKRWADATAEMARRGQFRPIEAILQTRALGKLTTRDLMQAWSWFHVAMQDAPERWVALLSAIRREKDAGDAFREAFGFSAAEFQDRVVARLTGTRRHLMDGGAPAAEAAPKTEDAATQAGRIRAAPPPEDRAGAAALVVAMGHADDLLRETAFTKLLAVKRPEARAAIVDGLASQDAMARAYCARLCRMLAIAEAKEPLRRALGDAHWLVRAEAALASAAIRDWDSQARIREMLGDASPKARIGASDALRSLGAEANPLCVPLLVRNLDHADWQVKIATAQALAVLGDARAVGPLIERLDTAGGRIAEEYLAALRAITGDDLGGRPDSWRKWWDRVGPEAAVTGIPKPPVRAPDERYAPPSKSWGIEYASWRIGFLVDVSRSTNRAFTASPAAADLFQDGVVQGTIQSLFRGSVARTLRGADARTKFGVWCFSTSVARWSAKLEAATAANVEDALGFLRARTPDGETDFHRALRSMLDVPEGDAWLAGFRETPDTVFLLTDGTPTDGALTDPEMLLRWYTELNRYARVRTHTVAFGALGVDERLLEALAKRNGGTFSQVGETNPR